MKEDKFRLEMKGVVGKEIQGWVESPEFILASEEGDPYQLVDSIPQELLDSLRLQGVAGELSRVGFDVDKPCRVFWEFMPTLERIVKERNLNFELNWELLAKLCVERLTPEQPGWDKLAMLFLREHIALEVFNTTGTRYYDREASKCKLADLESYLHYGTSQGYLMTDLEKHLKFRVIANALDYNRDFEFTYLGLKTLMDKYLLKNSFGRLIETPQMMFMGISIFLAQNEHWDRQEERAVEFYNALSKFEVMLATPILANARTTRMQLNSCYVGSTADNIESIFDSFKSMALISKNGGGIGWDFSQVRAIGSSIDGMKNVGGGLIPWLKITNDIAVAVDQLGTRKGAIAAWCEIWHLDIEDFIELRKNSGDERRRAHDLFPALWVPDEFMRRVKEDKDWTLLDPHDFPNLTELHNEPFTCEYRQIESMIKMSESQFKHKTIKAKELWKKILTQLFETGLPFIGFKDTANRRHLLNYKGVIRSSNLCTEIFQVTKPSTPQVKIVGRINGCGALHKYTFYEEETVTTKYGTDKLSKKVGVTDTLIIDDKLFQVEGVSKITTDEITAVCTLGSINLARVGGHVAVSVACATLVRMLDNVIDLNCYPIKSAGDNQKNLRAIGIGIMGEAEWIASKGIRYGSDEHIDKINDMMEVISYNIISASNMLALEREPFSGDSLVWSSNISSWASGILPIDTAGNIDDKLNLSFPLGANRCQLCDWAKLKEEVKSVGVRNAYLMAIAPTSSISILCGTTQSVEPLYAERWYEENISGLIPSIAPRRNPNITYDYVTAYDVDPKDIIRLAAVRQKWLDQGQSLNIFVPSNISGKELSDIYMLAWELGLKSTYYCRSKNTELEEQAPTVCDISCESCQ